MLHFQRFIKVRKVKAVFHTLNFLNLDVSQKCLIAECWIPTADLDLIRSVLSRASVKSGSSVPPVLNEVDTKEVRPTFFRTNKFTSAFQASMNENLDRSGQSRSEHLTGTGNGFVTVTA